MAIEVRGEKFLSLPETALQLGVTRMTVYRWARRGKTANDYPLIVRRDELTHRYFISEKSVTDLANRYADPEDRFRVFTPEDETSDPPTLSAVGHI